MGSGGFRRIQAELQDQVTGTLRETSKIVDHHIELSCQNYRMDFNSNGTITSVNCQRPLGG
jgi:hypothetical protein